MVQPLLDQIDRKESIRQVERHLESFSTISKKIVVTDLISISASNVKDEDKKGPPPEPGEKLLSKIETVDSINKNTEEYIRWICGVINSLDSIHRKMILWKYYYKMDKEEIEEASGYSKKVQYKILDEAKTQLIFLTNEEVFE